MTTAYRLVPRAAAGLAASLLAAGARPASAQINATPRSLGIGGAYVAVARGTEALFQNPANLALLDSPRWSLFLPQITAGATVVGYGVGDIDDLFNGTELTQSRRDELLGKIPASGTEGRLDVRLPIVAFQYRRLALGLSATAVGSHTVGRDLVELALNGYQSGRTDYRVGNTGGRAATLMDGVVAYGFSAGSLRLGAAAHYYRGTGLTRTRMFEPRYAVNGRSIEVDYVGVSSESGNGYGVDLGAAYELNPKFTLSGAVSNAFSRMRWSEELRYRRLTIDSAGFDDVGDLYDSYEDSDAPLDPSATPVVVLRAAEGLYDRAYFPATLRVGAAWEPTRRTRVGASYEDRLTRGMLGSRWKRTAALGLEQSLPFMAVRGGFATNLDRGTMLAAGLSLGPVDVGVAKLGDATDDDAERDGWVGTLGLGFRGKALRRR